MRILELRQSLRYANLERLIVNTAAYLRQAAIETTILVLYNRTRAHLLGEDSSTLPEPHPLLADAARQDVEAYQVCDNSMLSPQPLSAILRTLRSRHYDLIHTHDFKTDVLGLIAGRLMHVPVIATAHGYPRAIRRNEIYRRLDIVVLRLCRHVVCVSDSIREELCVAGLRPDRLSVVYNGITVAEIRARAEHAAHTLRDDLHLQPDDVIVMTVGRLSSEKGHRYLMQAMPDVLAANPRIRLVVVGDGLLRQNMTRQAAELGIAERVFFLGFRSDVPALMAQCDLLVNPSVGEALGNVILEAMALGKPVIGTTAGGMREVIEHGETGLIVPFADSHALADAIRQLAADPQRLRAMGERGRARVLSDFTVERMAEGLAEVFRRSIASP
jgi:glycosyltransferase involved in cell wall biosynthesis